MRLYRYKGHWIRVSLPREATIPGHRVWSAAKLMYDRNGAIELEVCTSPLPRQSMEIQAAPALAALSLYRPRRQRCWGVINRPPVKSQRQRQAARRARNQKKRRWRKR